jgi:hypothetical protein
MAIGDSNKRNRAIMVAVSAEMVYQLTGSNMSSPQTAELNAGARAPTLKKWVMLTNVESLAWILFLTILDMSLWPIIGGLIALGGMVWKYDYAIKCGLKSNAPATENYNNPGSPAQPGPVHDGQSSSSARVGQTGNMDKSAYQTMRVRRFR